MDSNYNMTLFILIFVFRFQAHGDHLPVAPPAPAHAQEQLSQAPYQQEPRNYDVGNAGDYDDGQYDPRYNDPGFNGRSSDIVNVHHQAQHNPAPVHAPAPQQYQPHQAPPTPSYVTSLNHEQYNQHDYQGAQFSTTPNPHRFQPPGKLSLSRTPDGFSYTFNKV